MPSTGEVYARDFQLVLFPQPEVVRIPFQRASLFPILLATLLIAILDMSSLPRRQLTCNFRKTLDKLVGHLPQRLGQYEATFVPLARPTRGIGVPLDVDKDMALKLEVVGPKRRRIIQNCPKGQRQVVIDGLQQRHPLAWVPRIFNHDHFFGPGIKRARSVVKVTSMNCQLFHDLDSWER